MSLYQDHEGKHRGVQPTVSAAVHPYDEKRAEENAYMRRAQESRVRVARERVHAIAMELAEDGLSIETVTEAMLDMARTGAEKAAKYIREYDRDERERADDAADRAEDYARGEDEEVES